MLKNNDVILRPGTALNIRNKEFVGLMKYRYRYADIFSYGNSSLHAASTQDYTRHYICILYNAVNTQNYITKDVTRIKLHITITFPSHNMYYQ
jgi:hypothetical protein